MKLSDQFNVFGRLCGLAFQRACQRRRGTDTYTFVFHDAGVIYIPVPKAGTTSALHVLENLVPTTATGRDLAVSSIHAKPKFVRMRKSRLAADCWSSYFSFCFVRNPFDRLVSAYKDKIVKLEETPGFALAMGCRRNMPFDQFVERVSQWPRNFLNDHFLPQTSIISSSEKILPKFIGRFEDFQQDWEHVVERIEALAGQTLPRMTQHNASPGKPYREYYSNRSRAIAEEIYADDLEQFQYRF